MTTNLINNYISTVKQPAMQASPKNIQEKKPKPDFDIETELNTRTFIKPLKGKGHLVRESIVNAPAAFIKDSAYKVKAFKHALNGDANDHELGKLNDVGLTLGGIAIAGYLASRKQTPLTKGMEFVGLASFLASMSLWPKIAIQLPAYLIHGVNVKKQYEDSFGRKKPFYQDPQFIPWDLYSDKEIQKMGNRLGISKKIPNRRDAIQEKMKKLAIQNNTLWMLTAGFATPVMSALICNQTEPLLAKWLNNRKNKNADEILTNLDAYSSRKYSTEATYKKLDIIIGKYNNKPVNDELIQSITDVFTENMDLVTAEKIKLDLKNIMQTNAHSIDENSAKEIAKNLRKLLGSKPIPKEAIVSILPDEAAMVKLFKDYNLFNPNAQSIDVKNASDKILYTIITNIKKYNENATEDKQVDLTYVKKLIASNNKDKHPIKSVLNSVNSSTLNSSLQEKLHTVARYFDLFAAKRNALNEYAVTKVGSAPETVIANYWNNISNDLLKTLGISSSEIEKVRFDRSLLGELLRGKIEKIVSNDTEFNRVMKDLVAKVAHLNSEIKPSDLSAPLLNNGGPKSAYDTVVDTEFDKFAKELKKAGFTRTAEAITNNDNSVGTLKNVQKAFVSERLLGVKSSFYRLINTLDFYRRIATHANDMQSIKDYPREIKEEIIELCKIMTLQGHSSDSATKFYMLRNPHPSMDRSPLEVKNGKVVNKYFGNVAGVTDIPGDKYFYQHAMQLMFEEGLSPETKTILGEGIIKDEVKNYRNLILEKIGGESYFAKPRHRVRPVSDAGSELKFLLTGIAPDELFFKAGQQAYNTKKWLKIFGTFGGVLLGVTVLAQFFLGKMPNKKVDKK